VRVLHSTYYVQSHLIVILCSDKYQRVVIVISTHSHPQTGDLWINETPECLPIIAVCLSLVLSLYGILINFQFFQEVLGCRLMEFLHAHETMMFIMSCGAFASNKNSRASLL
jgi:hypothetical protein